MNHPKYFRASSLVCLLLVLVFGFADPVFGQAAVEGKEKSGQSSDGRLEAILENSTQEETKKQIETKDIEDVEAEIVFEKSVDNSTITMTYIAVSDSIVILYSKDGMNENLIFTGKRS